MRQKNDDKLLNLYLWNYRWQWNLESLNKQTDASCTKCVVGLCYIFHYFNTPGVICSLFKAKQSTCQVLNMVAFLLEYGKEENILMSIIYIYLTDFKAKWIKPKIVREITCIKKDIKT